MTDTIYAFSTPMVKSGVAVLRISGPQSLALMCDFGYGKKIQPRIATYHKFAYEGEIIDHGLFIFFPTNEIVL